MTSDIILYGELFKLEPLDDGTIRVHGVASTGARDGAGEVISPDALRKALPAYMAFPAVREMHGPRAAGATLHAEVDEEGETRIVAHVVDPVAVKKVRCGVYKGLSIGGRVLERDADDPTRVTAIRLDEISLVDRPCNPQAVIDLWKAAAVRAPSNEEVRAEAERMAKAAGRPGRRNDYVAAARAKLTTESGPATPFPLDGGRTGDEGGRTVGDAVDAGDAAASSDQQSPSREHPHPNPSPIEGEGLVDECGAILESFLGQFYEDKPTPRLVLLSHDLPNCRLLADALCVTSGHRVEIAVPRRGEKRELVSHALTNAREALGRRMAEGSAQTRLLAGVCEAFKLEGSPERIEVYDNSHIMGTNAVGAMVVAGPEGFQKGSYRKFNIRGDEITPGDDFGMMREVFKRRFGRLVKEEEAGETPPRPDLVLVDGGQGQLDAALTILRDLGLHDIACVGVAKGPDRDAGLERFFLPGHAAPFMLEPKSPVLYYLQRLRDEAHRFAIGTHRAKRRLDMARNPLDEIEGVGPGRKRALLHAFGSARGVSRASAADLLKVEGVNEALAARIYGFFHKG